MTARITGLVNTRNAAATLDLCLESLAGWVDELLVVDMESSDGTVDIARRYGARVLQHELLSHVEPARAFGVDAAAHEWIMILDADEVTPPALGRRLRELAERDEADVVVIGRRNYLFGEPMRHGPFGPAIDRHARFFRRGLLRHSPEVHVPPTPASGARVLVLPPVAGHWFAHFAYADVSEWLSRMDRYTSIEAAQKGPAERVPQAVTTVSGALATFVRAYIGQRGYRDGWRGLHVCLLLAMYRSVTIMKIQQLRRAGTPEAVRARYRECAAEIIHPR